MNANREAVQHVAELVERAKISMLTTMTSTGKHVSRPMAVQDVEFDGDLWFFAYEDSDKATQLRANPQVNVSFSNDKSSEWTSVSGTAEIVHDQAKAEELWSAPLKTWFPEGLDTPGLTLIKVHADSAEYWESSSSKVVQLIGAARAAISGDPDKFPSTNEEVSLGDNPA
ncbi:pyridoxamine 5'-phosphate oxidase family protein [Kribbella sp. NPDC051952]|uniref:pyridoxamine 5'-phosphate oxidase family protein n=1 Tax=Kribbella sp. NPDC051952 TaxID=3154851 RepID=UPI00341E025C